MIFWAVSLHTCRWEVSVFELMLCSTNSGSDRWNQLKRKRCWMARNRNLVRPGQRKTVCLLLKINIGLIQICRKIKPFCSLLANTFSIGALLALQLLICYTNSVCMLLDLYVCVGVRWRTNFWRVQCVFWFSLLASLHTWDYSCVSVDYFYLSLCFASAELQRSLFPFCTRAARLSGSRTAPRGSHVWLSRSCWRGHSGPRESDSASISGGDGDC